MLVTMEKKLNVLHSLSRTAFEFYLVLISSSSHNFSGLRVSRSFLERLFLSSGIAYGRADYVNRYLEVNDK
jgi:hypothetical protein